MIIHFFLGVILGLLDRLEKAGFVRCDRDPSDRRKVVIQPVLETMEAEIAPLFASAAATGVDGLASALLIPVDDRAQVTGRID